MAATTRSVHYLLRRLLHVYRRAVAQDLGDPRRQLGGVVADSNNGIGAHLPGVGEHQVERILARPLAQRCVKRDVPPKQALDARANVADDGPGILEADMKKVFDKFYRAEGATTGGTGLGLPIAKGFVEAHRGTLTVRNRMSRGTEFRIEIPFESEPTKL